MLVDGCLEMGWFRPGQEFETTSDVSWGERVVTKCRDISCWNVVSCHVNGMAVFSLVFVMMLKRYRCLYIMQEAFPKE